MSSQAQAPVSSPTLAMKGDFLEYGATLLIPLRTADACVIRDGTLWVYCDSRKKETQVLLAFRGLETEKISELAKLIFKETSATTNFSLLGLSSVRPNTRTVTLDFHQGYAKLFHDHYAPIFFPKETFNYLLEGNNFWVMTKDKTNTIAKVQKALDEMDNMLSDSGIHRSLKNSGDIRFSWNPDAEDNSSRADIKIRSLFIINPDLKISVAGNNITKHSYPIEINLSYDQSLKLSFSENAVSYESNSAGVKQTLTSKIHESRPTDLESSILDLDVKETIDNPIPNYFSQKNDDTWKALLTELETVLIEKPEDLDEYSQLEKLIPELKYHYRKISTEKLATRLVQNINNAIQGLDTWIAASENKPSQIAVKAWLEKNRANLYTTLCLEEDEEEVVEKDEKKDNDENASSVPLSIDVQDPSQCDDKEEKEKTDVNSDASAREQNVPNPLTSSMAFPETDMKKPTISDDFEHIQFNIENELDEMDKG